MDNLLSAVSPINGTDGGNGEHVDEDRDGAGTDQESIDEGAIRGPEYIRNIRLPSLEEFQRHMMTHLPYRNWCEWCVKGRGKEAPRRVQDSSSDLPEVSLDFCFPTKSDGTGGLTILVARERHTRMTMATEVPSKSTGSFAARRVV